MKKHLNKNKKLLLYKIKGTTKFTENDKLIKATNENQARTVNNLLHNNSELKSSTDTILFK